MSTGELSYRACQSRRLLGRRKLTREATAQIEFTNGKRPGEDKGVFVLPEKAASTYALRPTGSRAFLVTGMQPASSLASASNASLATCSSSS